MVRVIFALCLIQSSYVFSQNPTYLGGGKSSGITVTASSSFHDPVWPRAAAPQNTVNDNGMLAKYFDAGRFLQQASIGFDSTHVQEVMDVGIEDWISDQFDKNPSYILPRTRIIFDILADTLTSRGFASEIPRRPTWRHFNYAWWDINMTNEDLLRQKVAAALSEIIVVSRNSDLGEYGDGLASFYDLLLEHAFGNYKDLLLDVTLHPAMGFYLSHMDNPKTDLTTDQHPDENYAREVMQLFSIGLYELNIDGSRKQVNGQEVPTYDNNDISEYAKVFTGLGIGDVIPELLDPNNMYDDTAYFGMGIWKGNMTIPMQMYETDNPATSWKDEDQHEDGIKVLLNRTIPAGQTGMQDIIDAIDDLFGHPNVGPFIAYRLIQRLVKSNPTPGYVQRVATAFNGSGPYGSNRGDMKSVIRAILLDDEARQVSFQLDGQNAKLKEPLFRYTQFARAVEKYNANGFYWNIGYGFYEDTKQAALASPSVFNFYFPDDAPNGEIHDLGLVAPEFKIHDARTSIGYINNVYTWAASWGSLMGTWEGEINNQTLMNHTSVKWVIDDLLEMAEDTESYLNWLDKKLLLGRMSDKTRKIVRKALNSFDPNVTWHHHQENRVRIGLHLAMIAPEYNIMN